MGGVTVAALKIASVNLAWSTMLNEVTNGMMAPGQAIERAMFNAGTPWDTPFILISFLIYFVAWFIILSMIWSTRSSTQRSR
ncbi:MAG: hypothetical protein WA414_13675 [Acidobacteriaceae bacterium]